MDSQPRLELSVEELLARLRLDRDATLLALHQRQWRLTSVSIQPQDFWLLFDATVRPDGTIDLSAYTAADGSATAAVAMCLAVCATGQGVVVTLEHADDGTVTMRAAARPTANDAEVSS